jgi:UDP-N-acetylglucosamine transferase subunit ALG13
VGNATQPFDRLLLAVAEISAQLPQPVFVQRGASMVSDNHWQMADFVPMDEFERLIRSSSVLIMHAGAGSIIHAVRANRLPVVMPRQAAYGEHIDDHQVELATALASTGHVLIAQNVRELRVATDNALSVLGNRAAEAPRLPLHIRKSLAKIRQQRAGSRA